MATNNPIDSLIPIQISYGATNATSFATSNGTIVYDGTRLVTTATGSSGDVLTSAGSGTNPSYQALTASGTHNLILSSHGTGLYITNSANAGPFYGAPYADWVVFPPTPGTHTLNFVVPFSGTLGTMYAYISGNTLANSSTVFLQKNGVTSSLGFTIGSGATGTFSDLTHTVSVSAGDYIQWISNTTFTGGSNFMSGYVTMILSA